MQKPQYYSAVYGIIQDDSGKVLCQRRANTGFNDGILQFPSGHIEGEETYFGALAREMKEEINIDLQESDVTLSHILHRISKGNRVYFDIFFTIHTYTGEVKNLEPDKCSELDYFDEGNTDITDYNREVLKLIEKGVQLSELVTKI